MKYFKFNLKVCISLILTLVVLSLSKTMFFNWKSKISIYTDASENTKISVEYRKTKNSSLKHIDINKAVNGKYVAKLKGRKIFYIRIDIPSTITINKVKYSGLFSKDIMFDNNNSAILNDCYARPHIYDLYNFIVISVISFYLIWFYVNAFVNRNLPKEPEKNPSMLNIEFLRVVFTLLIIAFHSMSMTKLFCIGRYAVEFFFVLSGFFFALKYNKTTSIEVFIKNKLCRFLPVIIFASLINGLFRNNINFSNLTASWLFMDNTGLFNKDSYTVACWYVSCLFWITLFMFYLLKNFKKETANLIIGILTFLGYAQCVKGNWARIQYEIPFMFTKSMARGFGGIGLGYFIAQYYLMNLKSQNKKLFNFYQYTILEITGRFSIVETQE